MEKAQEESKVINVNTEVKTLDAETATEATNAVKKPRGLVVTAVITSILAVAGVAFGVYGMLGPVEEPVAPGDISQEEDQEAESVPSVAEVTKLLADKYGFDGAEMLLFNDSLAENLDDFGLEAKLMIVTMDKSTVDNSYEKCDYREEIGSCVYKVGYDKFNERYHYYFAGEDLAKTDYDLANRIPYKLVYLADTDEFEVYFPDGGIGGYSTKYLIGKVSSVRATIDGYVATVVTAEIDTKIDGDYDGAYSTGDDKWTNYVMISEEDLAKIQDSLSAYEFEFVVEDGESKLVNIRKI